MAFNESKYKKVYIGDKSGKARLLYAPNGAYRENATGLSEGRRLLAATTVGNHALFCGGEGGEGRLQTINAVDIYDTSLTRTTPPALNAGRSMLAATTVGNYALFGGGSYYDDNYNNIMSSAVDAYNTSLTRTTATELSVARNLLAATTVGNYALFGGGNDKNNFTNTVDAYNSSLTRTTATDLSSVRSRFAATTVGNYALFGGGDGQTFDTVDAYDTSLTRTTATSLSAGRYFLAATTVGNYALFGGGSYDYDCYDTVDAYDSSLTRSTATALSQARDGIAATTVGNYAVFVGGSNYDDHCDNIMSSAVDAYDTSLTRTTDTGLSVARNWLAATTVGNYALFGGGMSGGINEGYMLSDVVDAYFVI